MVKQHVTIFSQHRVPSCKPLLLFVVFSAVGLKGTTSGRDRQVGFPDRRVHVSAMLVLCSFFMQ